ncbi:MAG: GH25 family lysozyme [Myxococcota bacterium]
MLATPITALLLLLGSTDAITTEPIEPPEDAQMGDGLRLSEPTPSADAAPSPDVTCADGETIKGIDISKWQGDVDWDAVAADGVKFSFVRVSDGINTQDQYFDKNWEESRAAGIYTGVYQFFRPNQSVLGQADYLLEQMGCDMNARTCPITDMDLPPVIDVEHRPSGWSKNQMRNAVRTWIERVEDFGLEPVIYTGRYFWRDYVDSDEWRDHPLWLAHYTNNCPNIPNDWSDWDFWQFTDSGSISGVNGPTDTNQFNGTIAMLEALRPAGGGDDTSAEPCGTVVADNATIIDNVDACFELHGPDQYWRDEDAGHGGDLYWTRTTTGSEYNYAVWDLVFEKAGAYTLQAHIDPDHTSASQAKYQVTSADGTETKTVDQRPGGWVTIGTFEFDEGDEGQQVRLSDKAGVSSQQLQFDAIRLVPDGLDVDGEDCGEAVHDGTSRITDDGDRHAEGCSVGTQGRSNTVFTASLLLLGLWGRRRRS